MFSLEIVDTDKFLDMPSSAQVLYFHLGMRADDDGFVSSPRKITMLVGCAPDDMKILIAKGFVIHFENGVCVITDWKRNNYIQKDRYKETFYIEEKSQLATQANGSYLLLDTSCIQPVSTLDTSCIQPVSALDPSCIQTVSKVDTQVRLGKDSIDQVRETFCAEQSAEADTPRKKTDEVVKAQPEQGAVTAVITLPLNDKSEHPVYQSQIDEWAELYPAVDIMQELRNMKGWANSKPQRRKTKRGISSFINSWLAKTQNQGGRSYNPLASGNKGGAYASNTRDHQIGEDDDPYKDTYKGIISGKL